MIYVLVRDATDYDEDDEMIFASVSKEAVEKRHAEITARIPLLKRFAEIIRADVDAFRKSWPPVVAPDYAKLPPRPLVWLNGKWNNAYELEYRERYDQQEHLVRDFTEKAVAKLNELNKQYNYTPEELENWSEYLWADHSYSIQEVESD